MAKSKVVSSKVRKPIGVEHHVGQLKDVIKRLRRTIVTPVMDQVIEVCEQPRSEQRKADLRDASNYLRGANAALSAAVNLLTPPTPQQRVAMRSGRLLTPLLKIKTKRPA